MGQRVPRFVHCHASELGQFPEKAVGKRRDHRYGDLVAGQFLVDGIIDDDEKAANVVLFLV
jgi:hypothetical protein